MVARRRDRWRESVLGLERRAALLSEALSLMAPIRSLSFVLRPIRDADAELLPPLPPPFFF